ncbi:hypothetical protein [Pseudomonas sp. LFM046]|uniref:hypothetical protein n=1 Tax=Pseudomonas sp. LFM046 TaxID=1608357 RepID=UPI0005CFB6AC|nr:hypothetical protein [Pseudomonas sp. LFM046]
MNILHGRVPPALLAFFGLFAILQSSTAAAVPVFARRAALRTIPIAGVLAGQSEDIDLKGMARINSTTFSDPDLGGAPGVELFIDFLNVVGVGRSSGTRYFAHGENNVVRELRPTDVVELIFPIAPVNAGTLASTESVLAIFQLTFNVDTGQLLTAAASLSTPGL